VATTTGAAARNRDAFKHAHYVRRGLGGERVPVSVELFGRLGAPACALLCRVADVAADGGDISKVAFIESALQEMRVTLVKRNGHVLRARFPSLLLFTFAGCSSQWPRVPERVASACG
jgi:hypothetical protein